MVNNDELPCCRDYGILICFRHFWWEYLFLLPSTETCIARRFFSAIRRAIKCDSEDDACLMVLSYLLSHSRLVTIAQVSATPTWTWNFTSAMSLSNTCTMASVGSLRSFAPGYLWVWRSRSPLVWSFCGYILYLVQAHGHVNKVPQNGYITPYLWVLEVSSYRFFPQEKCILAPTGARHAPSRKSYLQPGCGDLSGSKPPSFAHVFDDRVYDVGWIVPQSPTCFFGLRGFRVEFYISF